MVSVMSPPGLMDDVDAVQAQIARNMLDSGDWVTARLDGVAYLEKAPLHYWLMAIFFRVCGVHDWAARIPLALAAVLLCLLTARFARWAMDREAGWYAGMCLATCVGLFLFTRILIPDASLTLAITAALFSILRALDVEEAHPRAWGILFWIAMAAGVLLKGLIGVVFPTLIAGIFLALTGELWERNTWRKLQVLPGIAMFLALAAPWHVLATLANPPYFDFTMHSESGAYHGFFWFYFLNEHLFRFLNIRYPRDYNTVPRGLFWLLHLVWLFPWSVYLPAIAKLAFRGRDRGSRVRLLALCWMGVVLFFFTFSTTQEYYSMPCYPAFAILLGAAMASGDSLLELGTKIAAVAATLICGVLAFLLFATRGLATPGDISAVLTQHPEAYTLSMGHMSDLTLAAFAYLRTPLLLAVVATFIGAAGGWVFRSKTACISLALMMVLFYQAARLALAVFEPYLGSRLLAETLLQQPGGQLILDDQYYSFSSVVFYTNRQVLLLNGRQTNLEYGSYATGAPPVFIDDSRFSNLWRSSDRYYLLAGLDAITRLKRLAGQERWFVVDSSGGKFLITNREGATGHLGVGDSIVSPRQMRMPALAIRTCLPRG
jgi:4-amino-4-deoxy-L-arabinose transferase-like glycosyltransferase